MPLALLGELVGIDLSGCAMTLRNVLVYHLIGILALKQFKKIIIDLAYLPQLTQQDHYRQEAIYPVLRLPLYVQITLFLHQFNGINVKLLNNINTLKYLVV
jgi:hypothetical protein